MLCHRARREGKALANFTQKAIRASFIKLLNQKPLSQITIKDIVDDCGVNRNTFYYYFQDLPDLVETITKEEAQRVIQLYPAIDSIEQCLDALIDFALENRKAVLLVRGERPILDEKYDLHKHVNVKYTEDGGAPPYDYAKAPLSHEDVTIDTRRLDDYELLSAGEILGREQSF